jgi:hypothetical protein
MWFSSRTIVSELRRANMRMNRPYAVRLTLIRRLEFSDMLVYGVSAGPAVDPDVVARRLSITVNGETISTPVEFAADSTALGEVRAPQGATVVLSLVDVDDAGNVSEPAVVEFTANDTIPPTIPGGLGVALLREEA